jgi:hypothetical protein
LPVLLKDCLGLDHALKHGLSLALQLGILARRVPIIAGARKDAFGSCGHLVQCAGNRSGDVEGNAAHSLERLGGNQ